MSRLTRCLLALSLLAAAPPARADEPDPKRKEAAEKLFNEGREAIGRGEHEIGCAKLRSSAALVPVVNTLANVARCEEREGHTFAAHRAWKQVVALLPEGDPRLAPARERLRALDAEVPKLVLQVDPRVPADARLTLDGSPIARGAWAEAIALTEGDHVISIDDGPRREERRFPVKLARGERRTLVIEAAPDSTAPPSPPLPPPSPAPDARRTAGWVSLGVGAAGLAVAAVTGGVLLARDAQIHDLCGGRICRSEGMDLIEGGKPIFVANAVAWGVGLAGAATGTVLLIVARRAPPRAALLPWSLPGGAGVSLSGRF